MSIVSLASSVPQEWQAVFLLIVFVVIITAAYLVTHFVARLQKGSLGNKNLEVIEGISVGQGKSLQLVRVGKKYIIIGVSKNEVNMLQTLDEDDIIIQNGNDGQRVLSFKQILNHYKKGVKGENGDDHHDTKDEE